MCYCFHSFKDLWPYLSAILSSPVTRVLKRIAKVQAFINSVQIFLSFSEDLFPRNLPENLSKNYTFLKWVAKVALFANSTKFFFHFSISPGTPLCLRTTALLKADGKDTTSILTIKVFL